MNQLKYAKTLGWIGIIFFSLALLGTLLGPLLSQREQTILDYIDVFTGFIISYGLIKTKKWAIYGLLLSPITYSLRIVISLISANPLNPTYFLAVIVGLLSFYWFYLAIKKFKN